MSESPTSDAPITIERATTGDVAALASYAAPHQADASRHIAYFSTSARDIASELAELDNWADNTLVARDHGQIVGWLAAETDDEIGRVWWHGPFADDERWAETADALLARARHDLTASFAQEEAAGSDLHTRLRDWAARNGFDVEPASLALEMNGALPAPSLDIRPVTPALADAVTRLHDDQFPGTHMTGAQLVVDESTTVHAAVVDDEVAGYVATQTEADGGLYIDFLGVDPAHRRRGIGADLIRAASSHAGPGTTISLTVRPSNTGARRLYESLGFTEALVLVPYRIGFSLR